jgi:hypothetical protein
MFLAETTRSDLTLRISGYFTPHGASGDHCGEGGEGEENEKEEAIRGAGLLKGLLWIGIAQS